MVTRTIFSSSTYSASFNVRVENTSATSKPPAFICVFGITGSGKSSFINDACDANLPVGHGQWSCTRDVDEAQPFMIDGREIRLIDTPGFDDTTVPDSEILGRIGRFLSQNYGRKDLITGMIYMHNITSNRFGGVSKKNFHVFRELCGPNALKNLIICTNFWSSPTCDIDEYERRERQLVTTPEFFKQAIDKGARVERYVNRGRTSAHNIIRKCLSNEPEPVQFQLEATAGATLMDTAAGKALSSELEKQLRDEINELANTNEVLKDAIKKHDDATRQEMEELQEEHRRTCQRLIADVNLLQAAISADRKRNEEERKRVVSEWEQHQEDLLIWTRQQEYLQAQLSQAEFQASLRREARAIRAKTVRRTVAAVVGSVTGAVSAVSLSMLL
ncbi:hypothetical protein RSOLAG1IB_09583 [Rhizoctonia solani AG-1 IB]|uniref:G domain-containing protein n=1 Tax=Thanatephorus cucumeris (strain AG1-IB / isolate 7/3/14) TaxID=1108050 RepID=A0A0B7FRQ1_THACB|nr:hypothetical protein RSOLAG1IB_09583 [Rhizoctonia solani AG-1 IB]